MFLPKHLRKDCLELVLFECPGSISMIGHDKSLENMTVGPVFLNGKVIGEIKNLYYNNGKAYFQNLELDSKSWNHHYGTDIIDLIIGLAREHLCKELVLEQLQTEKFGIKYAGNKSKFEHICNRLRDERKSISSYEFTINPHTGCYDIILKI